MAERVVQLRLCLTAELVRAEALLAALLAVHRHGAARRLAALPVVRAPELAAETAAVVAVHLLQAALLRAVLASAGVRVVHLNGVRVAAGERQRSQDQHLRQVAMAVVAEVVVKTRQAR
jgi:hypothetical protein